MTILKSGFACKAHKAKRRKSPEEETFEEEEIGVGKRRDKGSFTPGESG
jgi:hypothetical protein